MKTKALLLAGLVSLAGVATSQAETVYSVNAVGFVNVTVPTGFALIANPLLNGDNKIGTVLSSLPNGTTIYKFDVGTASFVPNTKVFGNWSVPAMTLAPGEGFFIRNTGAPYQLTFTGEVAQGNLVTPLSAGFQLVSSQVPQSGRLDTVLGYPIVNGETIYRFDTSSQAYVPYSFIFNNWSAGNIPTIQVGESIFVKKNAPGSWNRTFSASN